MIIYKKRIIEKKKNKDFKIRNSFLNETSNHPGIVRGGQGFKVFLSSLSQNMNTFVKETMTFP
jgi:hypothetical protein